MDTLSSSVNTQTLMQNHRFQLLREKLGYLVHMVVIGRGKGEPLYDGDSRRERETDVHYADSQTVLRLASQIADDNAELMRRLA